MVSKFELPSDSSSVFMLKFAISSITILIPTILMGGTLPVLVKYLSHSVKEVGKNVAILYFINSLGAVIGTVLAGFYFLQSFGLTLTTYIGAGIELVVGLVSLIISLKSKVVTPIKDTKPIINET
jgi:spermidine synthase